MGEKGRPSTVDQGGGTVKATKNPEVMQKVGKEGLGGKETAFCKTDQTCKRKLATM